MQALLYCGAFSGSRVSSGIVPKNHQATKLHFQNKQGLAEGKQRRVWEFILSEAAVCLPPWMRPSSFPREELRGVWSTVGEVELF